jgi:hypothetical protein
MFFFKLKTLLAFLILIAVMGNVTAQDGSTSNENTTVEENTVPEENIESPEDVSETQTETTQTRVEQTEETESTPVVRRPRRVLRLLDAHDPDFTDVRIPDYTVPDTKQELLADVEDPQLQEGDSETKPEANEKNNKTDNQEITVIQEEGDNDSSSDQLSSSDDTIRTAVAWGSLLALFVLLIILYRVRTGRRRRRVFRKIPSKRR